MLTGPLNRFVFKRRILVCADIYSRIERSTICIICIILANLMILFYLQIKNILLFSYRRQDIRVFLILIVWSHSCRTIRLFFDKKFDLKSAYKYVDEKVCLNFLPLQLDVRGSYRKMISNVIPYFDRIPCIIYYCCYWIHKCVGYKYCKPSKLFLKQCYFKITAKHWSSQR